LNKPLDEQCYLLRRKEKGMSDFVYPYVKCSLLLEKEKKKRGRRKKNTITEMNCQEGRNRK